MAAAVALAAFAWQPAAAETLIGSWSKAYLSNPALAAERARLRTVDEGVPEAKSGWRPRVTVRAGAGVEHQDVDSSFNVGRDRETFYPREIVGEVSQPLYRGGRTEADTKRAVSEMLAARAALINTEQQVLLAVGTAYMEVLRDQAVVELTQNNQKVLERQLQATRDRFSVGEVTRTDVSQAEASLSRAEADLRTAEGDLETSKAAYTRQVGEDPIDLELPSDLPGIPENLTRAKQVAAANNPAVVQALRNHEAASHVVRLIEGELYPLVELNGSVLQSVDPGQNRDELFAARATVDLTAPLYQSGSVYARVRAAKEARSQALQQIEDARRQAIEAATQAWQQLAANRARIVSLRSEIRANEIALEGVQQEALVGTRTVLDILDAEQALLDSRVNLVRARRDEYVAVFNVVAAVGGLTAEGLELDVEVYNPTIHYEAVRDQWFGTDPGK